MRSRKTAFMVGAVLAAAMTAGAWLAPTAEAHPPIGFRVAARSARVATRGAYIATRVPVRTAAVATRATYRAATTPLYRPYYYPTVRYPYGSPVRVYSYGAYPSVRYGYGFGYGY